MGIGITLESLVCFSKIPICYPAVAACGDGLSFLKVILLHLLLHNFVLSCPLPPQLFCLNMQPKSYSNRASQLSPR